MITSDKRDFLNGIASAFQKYREDIKEDEYDSCLCKSCLNKCKGMLENECNKNYKDFLCYMEDGECTTQASRNFCHLCKTDEDTLKSDIRSFKYQLFLEDYMSELNKISETEANARGLLVFHGLGSGKTCSGILLANVCREVYGSTRRRKLILMIPASLFLEPWMKELSKRCNKSGLRKELQKAMKKWGNNDETLQKQKYREICAKYQVYILHYNADSDGGWRDHLKRLKRDLKIGNKNFFDDSVILIDEVHNFTNSLVNISDESIVNSKKQLYHDIYMAKNARVIALTGTPVFNKPVELAYIFNMVRGHIDTNSNITFPTDEEEFNELFLSDRGRNNISIKNPNLFRRRINGLVSYYRGVGSAQFAEKVIDNVFVPLSSNQTDIYMKLYKKEIEKSRTMIRGKMKDMNRAKLDSQMASNVGLPRYIFDISKQKNYKDKRGNRLKKNGVEIPLMDIKERAPGLPSKNDIDKVFKLLDNDDKPLKINNDLSEISRKMYHALKIIMNSKGPILFYSRFAKIYGIGMFAEVLKQNGYIDFDKMKGSEEEKILEIMRRRALDKEDPQYIRGTYMLWTGDHKFNKSRKVFNKFENRDGSIIRCFLMTGAGKEGINLYGVRQVHILEPWWNEVIDNQVIGRAVRMCSHSHIPLSEFTDLQLKESERDNYRRLVNVYKYYGLLDLRPMGTKLKIENKQMIEEVLKAQNDMKRKSADYIMYMVSEKKRMKTDLFLNLMQDVAIDCYINAIVNDRDGGCFRDPKHSNYFESWDITDNSRDILKMVHNELKVFNYKNKNYYKDLEENIYEIDENQGVINPVMNKSYKKIGRYNDTENRIIFNDDYFNLDFEGEKKEIKIENKFGDIMLKKFGIDMMNKKVLFIGNRIKTAIKLVSGNVNLSVLEDKQEEYEGDFKKKIEDFGGIKIVNSESGEYFVTYIQYLKNWEDKLDRLSDLIIVYKSMDIDLSKIIYNVKELDENHYLIMRKDFKNEFYKNVSKQLNSQDILRDLPNYVKDYKSFEEYIKNNTDIPNSIIEIKNEYVYKHVRKFLTEKMYELYRELNKTQKMIMIENNIFTVEEFNKNKDLNKKDVLRIRSKKKRKKEVKKFDKLKLLAGIKDMEREKESTTINITLNVKNMLKAVGDKSKKSKKKSKIGEECKEPEDCFNKNCVDNKCESKSKKKKSTKKTTTKKKESSKKKTTKKTTTKKKGKSKIGEPCETEDDCRGKKPCIDNKCASTSSKKKLTKKKESTKKKETTNKKTKKKMEPVKKMITWNSIQKIINKTIKENKNKIFDMTMGTVTKRIKNRDKAAYKKYKQEIKQEINKVTTEVVMELVRDQIKDIEDKKDRIKAAKKYLVKTGSKAVYDQYKNMIKETLI